MRRMTHGLLAGILVAVFGAAACTKDNSLSPCEEFAELDATCGSADYDAQVDLCETALDSDTFRPGMECLLDCMGDTCDELDACYDECQGV